MHHKLVSGARRRVAGPGLVRTFDHTLRLLIAQLAARLDEGLSEPWCLLDVARLVELHDNAKAALVGAAAQTANLF
eukprot:SAG11_NODE_50_length_19992_cov_9.945157_24_plen_76_part_00